MDDTRRLKNFSESQYLKTADEMSELFADFPQLLNNTVEISKRCNLHFELFKKNFLPIFPTPKDKSISEFFKEESIKGLNERLKSRSVDEDVYNERYLTLSVGPKKKAFLLVQVEVQEPDH